VFGIAPSVEGILDFGAQRYRIDRTVPLGDIKQIDGKTKQEWRTARAPVAVGRTDELTEYARSSQNTTIARGVATRRTLLSPIRSEAH
jgi:hypothetical protein